IAAGARAFHPPVEGLAEAGYLTNESVFNLTQRPARLAVLGGGAIGCEMAQAFQRLGSQVTVMQNKPRLMDREDPEAAEIIQRAFGREGIRVALGNWTLRRIEREGAEKVLHMESDGMRDRVAVDEILVAVGRSPNVEGLGLEAAGVKYDARAGVLVDDCLRTSNPNVFAAGDVASKYKFTHTADAAARIVVQNALFMGRKKFSSLVVPWCTFTDPEVAHVGLYEDEARAKGIEVETFTRHFSDVDRTVLEGEEEGFVKVHVKKGADRILGATVVGRYAGELIGELTLAMQHGIGLKKISETIHPYPTRSEAIRHVADMYQRTRLTPLVKTLFGKWFSRSR
ncbi:MAG TPA: FAD-dependent oxidoreductase, partial [Nitrospirota bacterium]|nr:FAD-dependent oxidoreductase [Nitrospirota bacterium]